MGKMYEYFYDESQAVLGEIFTEMEKIFLKHAHSNDVLVVKANFDTDTVLTFVNKQTAWPGSLKPNLVLEKHLKPYFKMIRDTFSCEVLASFLIHDMQCDPETENGPVYATVLPQLIYRTVLCKVMDKNYKLVQA